MIPIRTYGDAAMEFIARVKARLAGRVVKVCDVVTIARPGVVRGEEELGLSLEDGKEIVRELQSRMIAVQVEMLEAASSLCIHCGRRKDIKDRRPRQFRTVYGVVRVRCRRFIFCTCRGGKARNEWPLRHLWRSNTTPEFRYLLAKFGSDMPYRRAAQLLTELLPLPNGSHTRLEIPSRWSPGIGARVENPVTRLLSLSSGQPFAGRVESGSESAGARRQAIFARCAVMRTPSSCGYVLANASKDSHSSSGIWFIATPTVEFVLKRQKVQLAD